MSGIVETDDMTTDDMTTDDMRCLALALCRVSFNMADSSRRLVKNYEPTHKTDEAGGSVDLKLEA